jgi:hypothetical protein
MSLTRVVTLDCATPRLFEHLISMSRPSNAELSVVLRNDPPRLRIRTREGERRKQRHTRSRRLAAERRAALAPES